MVFSISTMLCNHYIDLVPKCFHHLKRKHSISLSLSQFPQPIRTTALFSISMDLSILGISINRMIYDLLCLASLSYHNVFKVHPYNSMYQSVFHSFLWLSHILYSSLCSFICWWTFGMFPFDYFVYGYFFLILEKFAIFYFLLFYSIFL